MDGCPSVMFFSSLLAVLTELRTAVASFLLRSWLAFCVGQKSNSAFWSTGTLVELQPQWQHHLMVLGYVLECELVDVLEMPRTFPLRVLVFFRAC